MSSDRSMLKRKLAAFLALMLGLAAVVGVMRSLNTERAVPQPPIGSAISDLVLFDENKQEIVLDSFRGRKVVLLLFTTECPYCRIALKHLASMETKFTDKVKFVYSSLDGVADTKTLLAEMGLSLPVLFMSSRSAQQRLNVVNVPVVITINEQGVIVWAQVGQGRQQIMARKIQELSDHMVQ